MKIIAVVTLFSLVGFLTAEAVNDVDEDYEKKIQHCLDESGMAKENLAKLINGDIDDEPKNGKFLGCLYTISGTLNDAGDYQIDKLKVFLLKKHSEEETAKIIEDCTKEKQTTVIETAVHLYKCYHKHVRKEKDSF